MKVLVVDDEKLARDRLIRMVSSLEGYEVAGEASCGEDALRNAIMLDPDIVLLDIRMPGMDSLTVAERLSSLESPPALIFCTAFSEHAVAAFDTLASG